MTLPRLKPKFKLTPLLLNPRPSLSGMLYLVVLQNVAVLALLGWIYMGFAYLYSLTALDSDRRAEVVDAPVAVLLDVS